ncbi:hypothetical protein [Rufibacter sp. LB8]|uniref:hypothetical protein n=1 Tax=Rufibacter sp. LB8 TaxID=2777781 RepID=UPI00178C1A52|nr:hypothetical protein [Rufibacter sp. LB8]
MRNLSLKLEDTIFQETESLLGQLQTNRNRYINEALEFYNKLQKRRLLAKQLSKESTLVANESLSVLKEFEALEDNEA